MPSEPIGVLIVDDSAVIRKVLTEVLSADSGIRVIGAASDPIFAMRRMQAEWPDVIVLDIEMPRMDGLTFLRKLMSERPTPVVICSTLTENGARTTMQALSAGAVEAIPKPRIGSGGLAGEEALGLIAAVKSAARARVDRVKAQPPTPPVPVHAAGVAPGAAADRIVAIGTSTGGTQALEAVLTRLPGTAPGIVIVQHMPEKFTAAFAARLDGLCEVRVREARDGEPVRTGSALVAPGGRHMKVERRGAHYVVRVQDGPLVNRHRPSVDVLFRSVARAAGAGALGIIMTGMGDDGAEAIGVMQRAKARTVAQDEKSCVVFGMPKEAIRRGHIDEIVSLYDIPQVITEFGSRRCPCEKQATRHGSV